MADDENVCQFTLHVYVTGVSNENYIKYGWRTRDASLQIHVDHMLSTVQIWMQAEVVMWRKQEITMDNHY